MAQNAPCGCGRDYLTVPLGQAHHCSRPRVTDSVLLRYYWEVLTPAERADYDVAVAAQEAVAA
jgi:hypothetical protein